jgi:integrase
MSLISRISNSGISLATFQAATQSSLPDTCDLSNLKNDASGATVPIPEALVVALRQWRTECLYPGDEDWVFASVQKAGKSPLWFDAALQRQLRPAAIRAGITKHVGWHTFRHSLATLLVKKREGGNP